MIFSSLKLNNIGLYKGDNKLNLFPKDNKNIVLFGGKNGSGKTTILEAIKLCLYGNTIYGYTQKGYESFIRKTIHRGEERGEIELEFIFFKEFSKEIYRVSRKFDISQKFKEEFILYKNGEILKDLPKDYWQDFISDLIPPGLVNFFFFDGEKIEKLADDLTESEFVEDIRNLIGVSLIEDLSLSLDIIENKYLKEENLPKTIISHIEKIEQEKENINKEVSKLFQEKAQLNQKIQLISKEISKEEKEFIKKGGNLFKNYENLKAKKEMLNQEIEDVKNQIRELSSHNLPLVLGLDLVEELIKQLDIENKIQKSTIQKQILEEKLQELKNILKNVDLPKTTLKEIEKLFLDFEIPEGNIIHNLTENEISNIKYSYKELKENTLIQANKLFKKLENLEEELIDVERALQSVPKEDIIAPYLRKLKELEEKKIKLSFEIKDIEAKIKEYETKIKKLDKELLKLKNTIAKENKNKKVIELIQKSRNVLQRFKKEFIKRKISILEREMLEALYKLERKEDFIVDIEIDHNTFQIKLYDKNRRILPLDKLSAGERQILAIAFLWGLAKTSGKKLPVIIDTPLGRLDSQHRENLAKNYFPNISHQVILLSTDTEIDKNIYSLIEDYISHTYHLNYDSECMCTKIEERYFWNEKEPKEVKNEI